MNTTYETTTKHYELDTTIAHAIAGMVTAHQHNGATHVSIYVEGPDSDVFAEAIESTVSPIPVWSDTQLNDARIMWSVNASHIRVRLTHKYARTYLVEIRNTDHELVWLGTTTI